ncbi:hypothetical protein B7R21_13670 [Subtercola boreus]|uniref:Addiction module toxin, HicA family n=1 Tax=Subtercola boreus TaxID=120213 RepID=A0A3E0VEH0_9MICO|nr:hypothetical protein B7R21_13670 [Subtercola boreus]
MRARDINRKIERLGGEVIRQRGSHRLYRVTVGDIRVQTVVPQHAGDVPKGTLHSIQKNLEPLLGRDWLS